MNLPRKVLWGMGVALTFLIMTPVSAGLNTYGIGTYRGTPPASHGSPAPQGPVQESLDEEFLEKALNDLTQDDGGEGTPGTGLEDLLQDTRSLPNEPVSDGGSNGDLQVTQVPAPGTLALLAMGIGALGFSRRRKLAK
jgi:hypothetical protein